MRGYQSGLVGVFKYPCIGTRLPTDHGSENAAYEERVGPDATGKIIILPINIYIFKSVEYPFKIQIGN